MSIRVALPHATRYRYDRAVTLAPHVVRLRPAPHCRTVIPSYSLRIKPEEHFLNWQQDPFGNHLARLVFPERATELSIEVDLVAELTVINPFDFFVEPGAETFPFRYEPGLTDDLEPYLRPVADDSVRAWTAQHAGLGAPIVDFLVSLNRAVRD